MGLEKQEILMEKGKKELLGNYRQGTVSKEGGDRNEEENRGKVTR